MSSVRNVWKFIKIFSHMNWNVFGNHHNWNLNRFIIDQVRGSRCSCTEQLFSRSIRSRSSGMWIQSATNRTNDRSTGRKMDPNDWTTETILFRFDRQTSALWKILVGQRFFVLFSKFLFEHLVRSLHKWFMNSIRSINVFMTWIGTLNNCFCSIEDHSVDIRSIRSVDHTLEKINDYMLKIEFFETRLEQLAEQMEHFDLKVLIDRLNGERNEWMESSFQFPMLTLPEPVNISAFFGLVDFIPFDRSSSIDLPPIEDYLRIVVDQSNRVFSLPDLSSFPSIPKKKFLWQIDYKSVPYYLRLFNHRLFVCDKYGSIMRQRGDERLILLVL